MSDTIVSGTTTREFDLTGWRLVGVILPASLASTAMTFTASDVTGGTFQSVHDATAAISYVVAASTYVAIPQEQIQAPFLKLVFGSSETSKVIKVVLIPRTV